MYFKILSFSVTTESLEGRKPHGSSINEAKQDNDDEKPLATASQKLDDDSILEALEVHEKLRYAATFSLSDQ